MINEVIATLGIVMIFVALLTTSGCLTPGQALDKAINETKNITSNTIDGVKGWFEA